MKTFKFFSTFLVVMTIFALSSYSQGNVKTTTYYVTVELVREKLSGISETVKGFYSGYWTVWYFKTQWIAKGKYTDISATFKENLS